MLSLHHVKKSFVLYEQNKVLNVLHDVQFHVNQGTFACLTGPSGSGKSTILRSIYGTYRIDAGSIYFNSKRFGKVDVVQLDPYQMIILRRTEIGYVSQFLQTIPRTEARLTVAERLVASGIGYLEARQEAKKILAYVGLPESLWEGDPRFFSGGEKLLVNIARALITRPQLLLLDEPTASLDVNLKEHIIQLLKDLHEKGTTILMVSHDAETVHRLCQHRLEVKNGCIAHNLAK
ncbi:MAG: Phosphonates transport ATP-binding protein PhnL [Candidatus Carbobacillus altaicus]|uniref:Phosphonates transport ATP-binding protein PhnL n=1 Tax=Candidatus Carbonibacillus altaicus TaxID=2163959 RepID=A0A2R6Y291_9BACL|nr:MAG: Phosphonates transport ATP-binding protein PhnL [Candidatus Carbobacillus altaicus]